MSVLSIFLIALGLAMDAFAVSLTAGFKVEEEKKGRIAIKLGVFFGLAQGIMPVIGWFFGTNFQRFIEGIDHWIALILLTIIGGKMIIEAFKDEEDDEDNKHFFSNKNLLMLAIATSIDALAVGISFGCLSVNIVLAACIVALVTGILCTIAVYIGKVCGKLLEGKAELFGGVVLVFIGIKIFAEHTNLIEKLLNFLQ